MKGYKEFFGGYEGGIDLVYTVVPLRGEIRHTRSIQEAVCWAREAAQATIWLRSDQNLDIEVDVPLADFAYGSLERKYDESPHSLAADDPWENDLLDDEL